MNGEIRYQSLWGRLYITFSLLFGVVFILGAIVLEDITIAINLLLCIVMLIIGNTMLKKPYAVYNEKEIIQYSIYGSVRKHHCFERKEEVEIKNNHLYLNGKKLKMNNWFVRKKDWERAKRFYSGQSETNEDLVD